MKTLFRFFGYEPIRVVSPQHKEFQQFILRALKEMTVREVAHLAGTSLPTVQRWASGVASPVDSFKKHIMKEIEPEMLRREDELYDRLFGGKKKS